MCYSQSPSTPRQIDAYKMMDGETIKIDGHMTDGVWARVKPTGDFTQYMPNPGKSPSQQTEVRIAYDDVNIYVLFTIVAAFGMRHVLRRFAAIHDATNWRISRIPVREQSRNYIHMCIRYGEESVRVRFGWNTVCIRCHH